MKFCTIRFHALKEYSICSTPVNQFIQLSHVSIGNLILFHIFAHYKSNLDKIANKYLAQAMDTSWEKIMTMNGCEFDVLFPKTPSHLIGFRFFVCQMCVL